MLLCVAVQIRQELEVRRDVDDAIPLRIFRFAEAHTDGVDEVERARLETAEGDTNDDLRDQRFQGC